MEGLNSGSAAMAVAPVAVARTQRGVKWSTEMAEQLCGLLEDGQSFRAIGERLGVSRNSVAGQVHTLRMRNDPRLPAHMRREPAKLACIDCSAPITKWSTGRCHKCARVVQDAIRQLPAPDDLRQVADGKSQAEVAEHYGVGISTVSRWYKEIGIIRTGWREPTPTPPDLATRAPTMSIMELAAHYNVGRGVVRRWLARLGLRSRRSTAEVFRVNRRPIQPVHRDSSRAGQAAAFLQKWGPVYRCGPSGGPDANGTHWNRNGFILTDADMIARAERLGWEPESWRRLAA